MIHLFNHENLQPELYHWHLRQQLLDLHGRSTYRGALSIMRNVMALQ